MRPFILTQRKIKKWGKGSKSRRDEGKIEKGRKEGKFCLKWILFT